MKIKSLLMEDFLPFEGKQPIFFAIDELCNITIVHGENTKGKTSILNAFRWVLYARPEENGRPISPENLLNWAAKKEGRREFRVVLKFDHDGEEYELSRGAHLNEAGVWTPRLSLLVNGEATSQDKISRIINNIAPEEISRFFLFDGELLREYEELVKDPQSAKKIKASIERVLGVPALIEAKECVERVVNSARKSANEALRQKEGSETQTKVLAEKSEKVNKLKEEIEALEKLIKKTDADVESMVLFLREHEKKYEESNKRSQKQGERKVLQEALSRTRATLSDNLQSIWATNTYETIAELARKLDMETSSATSSLLDVLRSVKKGDECPVCTNEIDINRFVSVKDKVERLLGVSADPKSQRIVEVKKLLERNLISRNSFELLEKEALQQESQIEQINSDIDELDHSLQGYAEEKVAKTYNKKAALDQVLAKHEATLSKLRFEVGNLNADIRTIQLTLSKGASAETQEIIRTAEVAQIIHQTLESSVELLLQRLRSTVEDKASVAFGNLTSRKADYKSLKINDHYGLEILNADGDLVPTISAGASQIVALSLISGLNKTGNNPGPVIMDTPFGRLDEVHRSNILQYMPKMASQFIVFVHTGELSEEGGPLSRITDRIGKRWTLDSIDADRSTIRESS